MSEQTSIPECTIASLQDIERTLQAIVAEQSRQAKLLSEQQTLQAELLDLYKNVQGFLKVMGWFERLSVWLGKMGFLGALIYGAWEYFHGGKK